MTTKFALYKTKKQELLDLAKNTGLEVNPRENLNTLKKILNTESTGKSLYWQQIKDMGNPLNFTWKTSKETMKNYIDSEKQRIFNENYITLKEAYNNALEDGTVSINSVFPLTIKYEDEKGRKEKRITYTFSAYLQFIDGNNLSTKDLYETLIDKRTFKIKEKDGYRNLNKRTKKSLKGMGNDYEKCEVVDDEFCYIPKSGQCLFDCIRNERPEQYAKNQEEAFKLLEKLGSGYNHNIPICKLKSIMSVFNIKYNVYRHDQRRLRFPKRSDQLILCLIDSHYTVIRKMDKVQECIDHIRQNLIWSDKTVEDCSFETISKKHKIRTCPDKEMFKNAYVWDCETFKNSEQNMKLYANGYAKLEDISKTYNNEKMRKHLNKFVTILDQQDAIKQMLLNIDKKTPQTKKKDIKTGKWFQSKTDILMYAHNSSGFDSFIMLQQSGLKFSNMIEKGGIMSICVTSDDFENCRFIFKDTLKFVLGTLNGLCKSYSLPQEFCKGEINHDEITELNWKSKESEWKPYLINDVIALGIIFQQYITSIRIMVPQLDVLSYVSGAQMSFAICNNNQELTSAIDPKLRQMIQKSIKGGRVVARIQKYESSKLQQFLDLNGVKNIDDLFPKQYENGVKKYLSKTIIGSELFEKDYYIAFDATSLYPSAMQLPDASYLDIKNIQIMDVENWTYEKFQHKKFIGEFDMYIPEDLQFVPISTKTLGGSAFVVGHVYKQWLNDVDVKECLRFGITIEKCHQGVVSDPIQLTHLTEFVHTFFNERQKVRKQNPILGDILKTIMNSSYGKFGQKTIEYEQKFTTKKEFEDEGLFTEDVVEYQELQNGQIYYKQKVHENQNLSHNHIASYILSYSKRIMNDFVLLIGADKQNIIAYMDTDSFYIHQEHYSKLEHIQDVLGGGKNDYGLGKKIIKADFLGCKSKICYVLDEKTQTVERKVTWKGISSGKFSQIDQKVINEIKCGGSYMSDIVDWQRKKFEGITLNDTSKVMSIDQQLIKYRLQDNEYKFRTVQEIEQVISE